MPNEQIDSQAYNTARHTNKMYEIVATTVECIYGYITHVAVQVLQMHGPKDAAPNEYDSRP